MADQKIYKPLEKVPESGIYTVVHDSAHAEPHDVTCIKGRKFPPCRYCQNAKFELKMQAVHVRVNSNFARNLHLLRGTLSGKNRNKNKKPMSPLAELAVKNLKK